MQRAAPASAGMAKVAAMNVRPGPIGVSGAPNGNIPQLNVSSVGSGPQAAAASAQPPVAAPSASQAATTAAQQAQAQQNHQQQYIRELKRAYVDLLNDITKITKQARTNPQHPDSKEKAQLLLRLIHLHGSIESVISFFDSYAQYNALELATSENIGALFEHMNALPRILAELSAAREQVFGQSS